jgi:hypothetical protein
MAKLRNLVVIDKTILKNLMTNDYTKVSRDIKRRLFDMHTVPLKPIVEEAFDTGKDGEISKEDYLNKEFKQTKNK